MVPHTESGPFPAWIGVGGSPQSVVRAARLGFSLMLAIVGGPLARFAAYSELFERALEKFGRPPLPVGVHSPAMSRRVTPMPPARSHVVQLVASAHAALPAPQNAGRRIRMPGR